MIIAFDIETTGVDIEKDRPVQIGVVQEGNSPRILVNTYCNPLMEVEKDAVDIHGITPDKYQYAPDYIMGSWLVAKTLHSLKQENSVVVTYNGLVFDIPIVNKCLGFDAFAGYQSLDLYGVVMRYFPEFKSFKLPYVYEILVGEEAPGAHDAVSDCLNLLQVLKKICIKTGKTPYALAEEMKEPRPLLIMPFSKHHKGKMMNEVPKNFAKWLLDQNVGKLMQPDVRKSMEMIMDGSIHSFFESVQREAA